MEQKMNYFLLKKLESCFLSLYLDFRENRTEICHDLFRLWYETVYLFIFFLTHASQYPRIWSTAESLRFFKKKARQKLQIILFS